MRLRVPILLAFLVAFFNQLSGINAILYFAPRIFEMTGLGARGGPAAVRRHRRHQPHLHLRRPLADRSARSAHAADDRLLRLHRSRSDLRVGLLHRPLRDRAALHLRLHRRARDRTGHGDLGVDLGDLPEPVPRRRPVARQHDALGVRRAADDGRSPTMASAFAPGLHLPLLLRHDGARNSSGCARWCPRRRACPSRRSSAGSECSRDARRRSSRASARCCGTSIPMAPTSVARPPTSPATRRASAPSRGW